MLLLEKKIAKVGNSLGVVIPIVYLEKLGVTHQDAVEVEYDETSLVITIRNKKTTLNNNYFKEAIKSVVDERLKEKGLL